MIKQLQTLLHQDIPLTRDMGMKIISFDEKTIKVTAPLNRNINDKGSVFGGASSALMIITGWSLIKLNCEKYGIDADIVIHKNETLWQKALYKDLSIKASFKINYHFKDIRSLLDSGRHKRITCIIELEDTNKELFSTMKAKYVIINRNVSTHNNKTGEI